MNKATSCYKTTRRVEFRDTDAAGIAHFSAFFVYMEQAEHELWRHLQLSVVTEDELGKISWPRVSATCDYHRPVRFEDVMDVTVAVERLGAKSVTYQIDFSHGDQPVATGRMTTVCCRIQPGQTPQPIAIPAWLRKKLDSIQD